MIRSNIVRAGLPALILAAAVATSASAEGRFTFPRAEFLPDDIGMQAAQAFVANELPAGLPMSEAIARTTRADTACHPGPGGAVDCRYFIASRPEGGDLGEDFWNVRLVPGADGHLQAASVRRWRVGMESLLGPQ